MRTSGISSFSSRSSPSSSAILTPVMQTSSSSMTTRLAPVARPYRAIVAMAGRDVELRAMLAAQQIALAWVEKLLWLEIEPLPWCGQRFT